MNVEAPVGSDLVPPPMLETQPGPAALLPQVPSTVRTSPCPRRPHQLAARRGRVPSCASLSTQLPRALRLRISLPMPQPGLPACLPSWRQPQLALPVPCGCWLPRSGSPLCWAWAPTRALRRGAKEVRATVGNGVSRHNSPSFDVLLPSGQAAIYPPRRMAALRAHQWLCPGAAGGLGRQRHRRGPLAWGQCQRTLRGCLPAAVAALAPVCASGDQRQPVFHADAVRLRASTRWRWWWRTVSGRGLNLSLLVTAEEPIRRAPCHAQPPRPARAGQGVLVVELGPCPRRCGSPVEGHPSPAWSCLGRWDTGPGVGSWVGSCAQMAVHPQVTGESPLEQLF